MKTMKRAMKIEEVRKTVCSLTFTPKWSQGKQRIMIQKRAQKRKDEQEKKSNRK